MPTRDPVPRRRTRPKSAGQPGSHPTSILTGHAGTRIVPHFGRRAALEEVFGAFVRIGQVHRADGLAALVDFGWAGRLDLRLRETIQELLIADLQSDPQPGLTRASVDRSERGGESTEAPPEAGLFGDSLPSGVTKDRPVPSEV
ncbi:hypothetical protein [Cryobacterium sp. TMT3-29-2]|uniref:hypothetical protein n=1 Tax=Cryobacterium sp. TMT3-29-2 TaxID=2555867 RepID=UPI0010737275|nr:hypothetical protein [Cryobacterium sp. TMT3-29-2]